MRKIAFGLTLLLLFSFSLAGASADQGANRSENFVAPLSGDAEVPAVETRARGLAKFHLSHDGEELHYRLIAANIEDILMAHIHVGGPDENGGVVAWLYPEDGPPPTLIEGRFNGVLATGTVTADDLTGPLAGESFSDLLDAIQEGNTYVNVHTVEHGGGEIRGQIQ